MGRGNAAPLLHYNQRHARIGLCSTMHKDTQ